MRAGPRRPPAAILVLAVVLVALTLPTRAPLRPPDAVGAGTRLGPTAPSDWLAAQRTPRDPAGWQDAVVAGGRGYSRALAQAAALPVAPLAGWHEWADRGPRRIGGRITDLAFDRDRQRLYVATASGGMWASDDGGRTLAPTWPDDLPQPIGAVAVLADGTVLAGTGEANAGGGSITFGGTGLYRSADAGATWAQVGLPTSFAIARILAHPTDPSVAWVAAAGNLFVGGGDRGVFRTDDGGRSWALVLPGATDTTGGADLALDPSDPDHLIASLWDRQRTPSLRRYGGPGSGLQRSRDGGRSWTAIDGGLPSFDADSGRIAVSFAPSDPDRLYAVVTRGDGRAGGLWRSDDAAASWSLVQDGSLYRASQFIFGWWFSKVFVDPSDADRVLVPGVMLLESRDAGASVSVIGQVHPDHHALLWDPDDPARAWLATDGGLYTSLAGGAALTWVPAEVQGFTQHYTSAVSPAAPARLIAGTQDNGCLLTRGGSDAWEPTGNCGDGVQVLPHPTDPDEVIICGQYARCSRSTTFGDRVTGLSPPPGERRNWRAPIVRVPGQPQTLLIGTDRVARSADGGESWAAISSDLTLGTSPDLDYPYGTLTVLHLPPAASGGPGQEILAGTDDGLVWRTSDGGDTWSRLLAQDRWVTGVATAPQDANLVLVTTSGYFAGDEDAVLLRSSDGGGSWQPVGHDLPSAPLNAVQVLHDDAVVVASDVGVFVSYDALEAERPRWSRLGHGLPQVPVLDLDPHPATSTITAATFGRGSWRLPLTTIQRSAGTDRWHTAADIALAHHAERAAAPTRVLIASGEDFPDALAAAPIAADDAGTALLLTAADHLPVATAEALSVIGPAQVIAIGGAGAVAPEVLAAAARAAGGASAARWAGADRAATAVAVAEGSARGGAATVVLTSGDGPADALAGAPYAAAVDAPILLTGGGGLPPATEGALRHWQPRHIVALGGDAAVSAATLAAAADAAGGATTERIAGASRTGTAAALAAATAAALAAATADGGGWPDPPGGDGAPTAPEDTAVWLVSPDAWPDALGAGATGRPLLLSGVDGPDAATARALALLRPRQVRLAGGTAVLPERVADVLRGS